MNTAKAIETVKENFPFKNYFRENLAPWITVGEAVQKYLKPGEKIFDLGSGACDKTAVAQVLGYECTAVDDLQDDWHLRGNNVERIEAFAQNMGVKFSRDFKPPAEKSFDMVMMNDVLEHIHDSPRELLNTLVSGLRPEGYLFVTVPNLANFRKRLALLRGKTNLPNYDLYYWYKGVWRGPQREYVRGDLVSMCDNLGLEIVELKGVHHMLQNLPKAARPIYKLLTAVLRDWKDTWFLVAQKPEGWTAKLDVSEAEFARIYGRTANENLYAAVDE